MANQELCNSHEARLNALERGQIEIMAALGEIKGSTKIAPMIIRWIVFPLVAILGALYGIEQFTIPV